jgi:hypothetical protein
MTREQQKDAELWDLRRKYQGLARGVTSLEEISRLQDRFDREVKQIEARYSPRPLARVAARFRRWLVR